MKSTEQEGRPKRKRILQHQRYPTKAAARSLLVFFILFYCYYAQGKATNVRYSKERITK
jgi:hypothetical protein